jgi:AraC-like DNA-binding protein
MKLLTCGHSWAGRERNVPPELILAMQYRSYPNAGRHRIRYAHWVADYVTNTSFRVRVGSRSRPWRPRLPRTLYLYPPNTVYWEDYPKGGKSLSDFSTVSFRGGEAAGLDRLIAPCAGYIRFLDPEGIAEPLFEEIALIGQQRGEDGFWLAQAAFYRLIDLLRQSVPTEEAETRLIGHPTPPAPPSDLVRKTNAYLNQNLASPVRLADLAQNVHASVSTLSHRYHAETGETPMNHLMRLRMDRIKALLVGGQKLATIADVTGFSSIAHLSATFKRIEGVSPRAYRQSIRREIS